MKDPLLKAVSEAISSNEAWVKLGWLQFMRWFKDVEQRLESGDVEPSDLLKTADKTWGEIEHRKIVMEERSNDGVWLRKWLQAEIDFSRWVASRF